MKVKVCGMRDAANIAAIARLAPDYMGFIFYDRSPRFAGGMDAASLDALPEGTARVGVFVDSPEWYIREMGARYELDYVQLHGAETPVMCAGLRDDYGVIKAFGVAGADDLAATEAYEGVCDYYVYDTKTSSHGGSGVRFDHSLLASYAGQTPYLLSGGIAVDDAGALSAFDDPRCVGFDINSCFETAPGIKDPAAVELFLKTIKNRAL